MCSLRSSVSCVFRAELSILLQFWPIQTFVARLRNDHFRRMHHAALFRRYIYFGKDGSWPIRRLPHSQLSEHACGQGKRRRLQQIYPKCVFLLMALRRVFSLVDYGVCDLKIRLLCQSRELTQNSVKYVCMLFCSLAPLVSRSSVSSGSTKLLEWLCTN